MDHVSLTEGVVAKTKMKAVASSSSSVPKLIAAELHIHIRRNFVQRAVEMKGLHDLYQADLVEMKPYGKVSKGYKYLNTVINAFTKFAYAVPLKTKTGKEVAVALQTIFCC